MAVSQLAVNVALTGTSDSLTVLRIMADSPPESLPETILFPPHDVRAGRIRNTENVQPKKTFLTIEWNTTHPNNNIRVVVPQFGNQKNKWGRVFFALI